MATVESASGFHGWTGPGVRVECSDMSLNMAKRTSNPVSSCSFAWQLDHRRPGHLSGKKHFPRILLIILYLGVLPYLRTTSSTYKLGYIDRQIRTWTWCPVYMDGSRGMTNDVEGAKRHRYNPFSWTVPALHHHTSIPRATFFPVKVPPGWIRIANPPVQMHAASEQK